MSVLKRARSVSTITVNILSSIIGYTGQISQEEYNALSEKEKKSYSLTDIVGKAGIEKRHGQYAPRRKGRDQDLCQ